MKKTILSLLLVTGFLPVLLAQDYTITGTVADVETDEPIAGASIQESATKEAVISNNDGTFKLNIKDKHPVKFIVKHIAYEHLSVKIDPLQTREIEFKLHPRVTHLDEVTVTGKYENSRPYRSESVDVKAIEKSNISGIGNFLRNEPNVGGVRKGALGIDPVVRGFKYSQLNVQLNGGTKIEGGCPNRMDPATAHIDLSDLKSITILKGPYALKYGPNFGGVIDMTTHSTKFYRKFENHIDLLIGGQTNHTGFKSGLGIHGGNNVIAYYFKGNYKQYGDYEAGNEAVIPSSLEQYNVAGSIGIKPAEGHILEVGFDRSWGRNVDFPALPMDERSDDTRLFNMSYLGTEFGDMVNFIRFKVYKSHVEHEMDNKNRPFSDTVVAISNIKAINSGGKLGVNLNLFKGRLETGVDYEQISKDGIRNKNLIMQPNLPQFNEDLWNNALIKNLGVFVEWQRTIKSIDFIAALRYDYNTATSDTLIRNKPNGDAVYENDNTSSSFNNISFSAGITWHVNSSSSLIFSLGRGGRSPDMTERFIILLPISYDPYDYLGNPQLNPEVNNELDLGYRFSRNKIGSVETSVFFSYVTNYITGELVPPSEMKPQTKGVLGVKKFINVDKAYLAGFEFSYATAPHFKWFANLNAAYTMGVNPNAVQYVFEGGEVIDEQIIENDPLPEIPPFEANISAGYKFLNQKLIPEFNIRLVAAQKKVSKAFNETTSPAFTTLNFVLAYHYSANLKVYAGVNNIFNAAYYEHLNRRIIGSSDPLYEPGRLFYMNLIFNL
jgi:iron complex outermembrane receptor protein